MRECIARWRSVARLGVVSALLAAGCAGTADRDDKPTAARQAAEVNTQLGREYMQRGQYEVALDKLKRAVRSDARYAPAHTMLAVLYERLGEADLARKHYREAVRVAPDNGDVNNNYGAFLCRTGEPREAESYFLKAIEDPFYRTPAVALANAGACQLEAGNVDKAEQYLRQSLEYDQEFPDALLPMAGVSYRQGDYFRARAFLQRFEAVGVATPESLMMGYRIESRLNHPDLASGYANRLMERFPESRQAAEIKNTRQK